MPVEHGTTIEYRCKKETSHQSSKPPVDSLPRPEFLREHPPRTSRTYEIAQGIDDLAQVCFAPPTFSGNRGKERAYKCPFLVRQITGVSFDSLREFLLPRAVLFCPYAFLIKAEVSKHALKGAACLIDDPLAGRTRMTAFQGKTTGLPFLPTVARRQGLADLPAQDAQAIALQ